MGRNPKVRKYGDRRLISDNPHRFFHAMITILHVFRIYMRDTVARALTLWRSG